MRPSPVQLNPNSSMKSCRAPSRAAPAMSHEPESRPAGEASAWPRGVKPLLLGLEVEQNLEGNQDFRPLSRDAAPLPRTIWPPRPSVSSLPSPECAQACQPWKHALETFSKPERSISVEGPPPVSKQPTLNWGLFACTAQKRTTTSTRTWNSYDLRSRPPLAAPGDAGGILPSNQVQPARPIFSEANRGTPWPRAPPMQ